jgi:hypothetical protein
MTLLTIAAGLAKNVGLAVPTVIVSSALREWSEGLQMANEVGEELARRVDWGVLRNEATLTGDGTDVAHVMPVGFSRLSPGVAIRVGTAAVRPLARAEWNTLTPVVGVPRYFILEDDTIHFFPYLANLATVTASYQTKRWSNTGESFMADDNFSLIDEDLFLKGLICRWRRQKGMDYADQEAEYEAALQDYARFDDRARL